MKPKNSLTMNPEPAMHEISLPLDERNLAHVLTALALAGIADGMEDAQPASRCWWTEDEFKLLIPVTQPALFRAAHDLVQGIRWVEGIGSNDKPEIKAAPHHGLFTTASRQLGNPLISFHDQGITSSIFKTFSGQQSPAAPLSRQQAAIKAPLEVANWLFQPGFGVASWKFDCRIASHAYDLGFGSNEDQSGNRDPFYPAIELLSIAGAAFFASPHVWLIDEDSLYYCIWQQPISLSLAPLVAAALLDGIGGHHYKQATRGNAYGKGAAYRHFPEATLIA
jgi:hypothetical protein